MSLKIDPEFKNLIPPLSIEEHQQLEQNILRDGCLHELIVWNEIIIDGHNRYEICQKNDISFKIKNWSFDSREDAKEWIIRNQFGRRNISDYQRSVLALELKEIVAAKAKAKQSTHTDQGYQKSDKAEQIHVSKELAKAADVSHDTIHKVEVIEKTAPDPVKELARNNVVSINKAHDFTKAIDTLPEKRKLEVVEQVERVGKSVIDEVVKNFKNSLPPDYKYEPPKTDPEIKAIEIQRKRQQHFMRTIADASLITVDTEHIEAWFSDMSAEEIAEEVETLNQAIARLQKLKAEVTKVVSETMKLSLVKGGARR